MYSRNTLGASGSSDLCDVSRTVTLLLLQLPHTKQPHHLPSV
jgi:hypothetical protein